LPADERHKYGYNRNAVGNSAFRDNTSVLSALIIEDSTPIARYINVIGRNYLPTSITHRPFNRFARLKTLKKNCPPVAAAFREYQLNTTTAPRVLKIWNKERKCENKTYVIGIELNLLNQLLLRAAYWTYSLLQPLISNNLM